MNHALKDFHLPQARDRDYNDSCSQQFHYSELSTEALAYSHQQTTISKKRQSEIELELFRQKTKQHARKLLGEQKKKQLEDQQ